MKRFVILCGAMLALVFSVSQAKACDQLSVRRVFVQESCGAQIVAVPQIVNQRVVVREVRRGPSFSFDSRRGRGRGGDRLSVRIR